VGKLLTWLVLIGVSAIVVTRGAHVPQQVWEKIQAWQAALAKLGSAQRVAVKKPSAAKTVAAAPGPVMLPTPSDTGLPRQAHGESVKPLALLADKEIYVLGEKQQIVPFVDSPLCREIPVITGLPVREEIKERGIEFTTDPAVKRALPLLESRFAAELSEIHFTPEGNLWLYTREGVRVMLSAEYDPEAVSVRLHAVLGDLSQRKTSAAVIDMRCRGRIVVRPVQGG
jgi:hypothetical protein